MSGWMPLKSQAAHFYPKSKFFVLLVIEKKTLTLNTMFQGGCVTLTLFNDEKYYKNVLAPQMSGFLKFDFGGMPLKSQVALFYPKTELFVLLWDKNTT